VTNVSLVGELDADAVRSCSRRFWPYVLATLVGMAGLESIPADPLTITLGFVTLRTLGRHSGRFRSPDAPRSRIAVSSSGRG